jgi:hypothetical protein
MPPSKTGAVTTAFRCVDADRFTREQIVGLIDGSLGALRAPRMFTSEECAQLAESIKRIPFDTYDSERVNPPIVRFGPSLNDSRRDGELMQTYWDQAEKTRALWPTVVSPDPFARCQQALSQAWGSPVETATIKGERVYAGVLRSINGGALVHYDDVNREFPNGLFDQRIVGQCAFNMYISTTISGGETVIWRREWREAHEIHRRGYGYDERVTGRAEKLVITPEVGDGLLFNPHNLHAVRPTRGGSRIAFAFFLGRTDGGQLVMWS